MVRLQKKSLNRRKMYRRYFLQKYAEEKQKMMDMAENDIGIELDLDKIKSVLDECLDFSKPKLDDSIVDKFVAQIIPVDNCRYRWDLNFLPDETQSLICSVEGRKNHAKANIEDAEESPHTYIFSAAYSNISKTAKNAYQSHVQRRLLLKIDRSSHKKRYKSLRMTVILYKRTTSVFFTIEECTSFFAL